MPHNQSINTINTEMENLKHEEKPSEADEEAQPQQVVPVKAEANLADEDSETI